MGFLSSLDEFRGRKADIPVPINGALCNSSSNLKNLKTPAFHFRLDGKYFEKDDLARVRQFSCPRFYKHRSKIPGDGCVFKFLRLSVDGKHLMRIAVHARWKSLYNSLSSSAKQEREMTKFCVFWRTQTIRASYNNSCFFVVSQINFMWWSRTSH